MEAGMECLECKTQFKPRMARQMRCDKCRRKVLIRRAAESTKRIREAKKAGEYVPAVRNDNQRRDTPKTWANYFRSNENHYKSLFPGVDMGQAVKQMRAYFFGAMLIFDLSGKGVMV
jgi:DNA-directed RNA polymerase subunit RPC12/RpoP